MCLKSLYLKKECVLKLNRFSIIKKTNKNLSLLNFCNIYANNFEKLKKFHLYKIFNRIKIMFNENHNNFPLQIFLENSN